MSSVVRRFDTPHWSTTVIPFLMYCTCNQPDVISQLLHRDVISFFISSGTKWDALCCRSQSSCDRKKTKETKDDCKRKLGDSVDPFSALSHDVGSFVGTILDFKLPGRYYLFKFSKLYIYFFVFLSCYFESYNSAN